MKLNKLDLLALLLIAFIGVGALCYDAYQSSQLQDMQPTFEVVEAQRTYDYQYGVVLRDKKGFSFYLEMDLVKFSAIGVNVNDILNYGEL